LRQAEKKIIGEHEFTIQPFGGTLGYRLLLRLGKLVGAPVARLAGGIEKDADGDDAVDFNVISGAVQALADSVDVALVETLTQDLLAGCTVKMDGRVVAVQDVFDIIFPGNYGSLFALLGAVLEVNYKLPLTGRLDSIVKAGLQAASPQSTPSGQLEKG